MNRLATILCACILTVEASGQLQLNNVVGKYTDFKRSQQSARLHLVFNQDRYAAGDTVWFKAYFLNGDMSVVKGRQLVEFSLVSPDAIVLKHFLFAVNNGIGSSQVILPSNTSPGIYGVNAYNGWMKNFDPPPLFNDDLIVVGEKVVKANDEVVQKDFSLNIQPAMDGSVGIVFSAHEGSMLRFQELLLIVTNNDRILHSTAFTQGTRGRVPIEVKATSGLNHISILDKAGRVVAASGYNLPDTDANKGKQNITVKFDAGAAGFKTRQAAKLAITLVDGNDQPVQGEFSVKILNHTTFKNNDSPLTDDLAMARLRTNEPWRQILTGQSNNLPGGFTIDLSRNGVAFFEDGITPVPAGTRIVFYLQQHDILLQASALRGGRFTLPLPDIYGQDELIAIGEYNQDDIHGMKISWDEKSIKLPAPPVSHETAEHDDYGVFYATKDLIDKSFGFYATSEAGGKVSKASLINNALEERVNGADVWVDVRKFVTFGTMTELIREVVPSVISRMAKGKVVVQVALSEPMPIANSHPLYIIDNVVTRNADYFLAMQPSDISIIRVVRSPAKLLPLGLIGKNGIIIVETIKGNARPPIDPSQIIEGINPVIAFRSVPSDGSSAHRPYFRSTIFWAPTLTTGVDGKTDVEFYCSDDVGEMKVRIDGLTKDGRPFSGEKIFQVVLSK
ncbi:MAG TPA: hypothetical protein VK508_03100 [Cyclobacteriaceae bacterium]|nr:hypothetical protein [Cyclobacteriaceae bacterium]